MSTNQVTTKSYPENLEYGFMVCGINYGYSIADEKNDKAGIPEKLESLSFFSDRTVRKMDRFKNRILRWLNSWGISLSTEPGSERKLERSFFQCNWLDPQTRGIDSDKKITINELVNHADGFLNLLKQRRPSVIFLFGAMLIEALNDERIRPIIINLFGERTAPENYSATLPGYKGKKFLIRVQKFGDTVVIGCPHPQSRGLSDEYMAAIKLPAVVMNKFS